MFLFSFEVVPLLIYRNRIPSSARQKSPSLGAPAGPAPGWKTKTHRRYISKDRVLLKQLENALKGGDKARGFLSSLCRRNPERCPTI
jgi:hypothetical protein